jgi:hypothetical protein
MLLNDAFLRIIPSKGAITGFVLQHLGSSNLNVTPKRKGELMFRFEETM